MRYLLVGIGIGIVIGVVACLILFRLPGVTSAYWAGIFGVMVGGGVTIVGNLIERSFRMTEQKRAAEGQFKRDFLDKSIQLIELKNKYPQETAKLTGDFKEIHNELWTIFEEPREKPKNRENEETLRRPKNLEQYLSSSV